MLKDTTELEILSAKKLLVERGYSILEENNYGERGYHIKAHCFETGKNECFKPVNGVLFIFGLRSGKFDWYKFAIIQFEQKRSYRNEMYAAINGHKNSL